MVRCFLVRLSCLLTLVGCSAWAAGAQPELSDAAAVPHLGPRGEEGYRQFLVAAPHRAFAIASGGGWGRFGDAPSPEIAEREALAACQAHTAQTCLVYAVDDRVVLDRRTWERSWGPYANAATARRVPSGVRRGERFPDLSFVGRRPLSVAALRGQVTVLHFWGSWCPPCRREMPELARLVAALRAEKSVRFVLLQVREDFQAARAWADRLAKGLPLYDSGMRGASDRTFRLTDGRRIPDREIAMAFPTTYVLDKRGIVVFSHVGPVEDWTEYAAFLRDVAARSGR